MKMTHEDARAFIYDELLPKVRVSTPSALHIIMEDFYALEIALLSGNSTLVLAMASYISHTDGLVNGDIVLQCITEKIFD